MDRIRHIRELFDHSGTGLEIGPSHQPVFPKVAGYTVDILDYASAPELRAKYAGTSVNVDAIEDVDFVSDGRPIHDIIPHRAHYDFIFSSHVIEHVTDLLSYFKSCELLMKPGGVVALAVPDQRFIFDAVRSLSTTGDVLEAYHAQQSRHAPRAVFDFGANFCTFAGSEIWGRASTGRLTIDRTVAHGKQIFDVAASEGAPYVDVHGWTFTATSFRLLMKDLNDLGYLQLSERRIAEAQYMEFFVVMDLSGPGCPLSRVDLIERLLFEQAVSKLQLLSGKSEKHSKLFKMLSREFDNIYDVDLVY